LLGPLEHFRFLLTLSILSSVAAAVAVKVSPETRQAVGAALVVIEIVLPQRHQVVGGQPNQY
jgi:hypothetical protein